MSEPEEYLDQMTVGTAGTGAGVVAEPGGPDLEMRKAWHAAFTRAQAALTTVIADVRVNTGTYGYAYAPLSEVIKSVRKALAANGLAFAQDVTGTERTILVTTRIYHQDGWVEKFGPLQIFSGSTPQQAGSAITYGRRYALSAALGIAADEDNDGKDEPPLKVEKVARKPGPGAKAGAERVVALLQSTEKVTQDVAKEAVRSVMTETNRAWVDLMRLEVQDAVLEDAKNWLTRQAADAEQVPLL